MLLEQRPHVPSKNTIVFMCGVCSMAVVGGGMLHQPDVSEKRPCLFVLFSCVYFFAFAECGECECYAVFEFFSWAEFYYGFGWYVYVFLWVFGVSADAAFLFYDFECAEVPEDDFSACGELLCHEF